MPIVFVSASGCVASERTRGGATSEPGRSRAKFYWQAKFIGDEPPAIVAAPRDCGLAGGHGRSKRAVVAAAVAAAEEEKEGEQEKRPKRVHHVTEADGMRKADVQTNRRGFRIPADVTLRECSVVIIGSTCRICGRHFKCESDVDVHTRWRHNAAIGSLMDILDHERKFMKVVQKCDVCDMPFGIISDLRIHKRLIHKHRMRHRGRRRREMIRVRFKLNGVTTTDVSLNRRYIKLQNSLEYFVDTCTQIPGSLENERRQDDCAGNIDSSLPNRAADESHMQYDDIQPDKAANRYIVGKFTSTEGDAIARRTVVVGKSLVEISSASHKYTIPDSDNSCERHEDRCYLASHETTSDAFIETFATNIRDKKNSQRTNERKRRSVYCQSEISLGNDDVKVLLACQSEKSEKTSTTMSKQNSWSSESPHYSIRWSDEVAGTNESAGLANSLIDSVEIIINANNNNAKSYGLDGDTTKRLPPSLSRFNEKTELAKANSSVDDDIQEVLRITRGNVQSDINHESPNRVEREMLQNAISDTVTLPSHLEPTIYPEKCSVTFTTNFESSDYPSFMAVTESDYEFLANSIDKKLGIYLEDLHHYGIRYCNDLSEINNNNLEEYAVYAHQDLFETWKQSNEPPYASGLKANDNEVAVVLD